MLTCYDAHIKKGGKRLFGYVIANLEKLNEAQRQRYQQVYCGLWASATGRFAG